jgi:ribonuclease HII
MIFVGVDEVGRGPIAGPVAVCALACIDPAVMVLFDGVKDSKKLTEKAREKWFAVVQDQCAAGSLKYAVSFQNERVIDSINIYQATLRAVAVAVEKLALDPAETEILLDGSLHAPKQFVNQKTIIRGDATEKIISMASVVAKVVRDNRMMKLAADHPEYGFENHKGYGTAAHYAAIEKYGLLSCHRRSFLKNWKNLAKSEKM